jgi:hypothetical protein
LANADESAIQIHFGTSDKPLFTQYMDSKSKFLYAVSNKQNIETLLLIPPETKLDRFGMYT